MKITTRARKIQQKIESLTTDQTTVIASFRVDDDSIQSELRISVAWEIRFPVDWIKYPKNLTEKPARSLWEKMQSLEGKIIKERIISRGSKNLTASISARTKTGPAKRDNARAEFIVEQGLAFLEAHHKATGKRALARVRKRITELQAEQKKLLPELRRANSEYLAARRQAKEAQRQADADAIAAGEFWKASEEAIKAYFHPPFDKNYLSDVSARHRAALFLECKSVNYKTAYGNWGHKLAGTGRGWMCGIDDNGDEWGFYVDIPQWCDTFGDPKLEGTVTEGMARAFQVAETLIDKSYRQGDLLFAPVILKPGAVKFTWTDAWEIRESHQVMGDFERNGNYLRAPRTVAVEHTSHATVLLPPGCYRLHALEINGMDAD